MIIAVLVIIIIIITGVLFWQHGQPKESTAESSNIIARVTKHYVVPANETPTVAQIRDKESLQKSQEFYQGAENGDYVLVYPKAKLAILYRISIDKLVKVSPVTSDPAPSPSQ